MATAMLEHNWHAEMPPLPRAEMPPLPVHRRQKAPVQPAPLLVPPLVRPVAQPRPRVSYVTRGLFSAFMAMAMVTMGLYIHTLRIEGDANHQQSEIRQLKEGNHYLQVQLAQTTNLERVETEAIGKLKMVPRDESIFMALPKEVSDLSQTRIIAAREPLPTLVWPGF